MSERQPFKFIRKWRDDDDRVRCEYEASFWEGPTRAGETGRYVRRRCDDVVIERTDASGKLIDKRLLNTSPGVSYYGELKKALAL